MSEIVAQSQQITHTNWVSAAELSAQVQQVQQVMAAVMKDKEHYGTIPGCGDKPTLLQPGAQVLALSFKLAPRYEITERALPGDHREYSVNTTLISRDTGQVVGAGVGLCSTMESKYRWRKDSNYEILNDPIPDDYWKNKGKYKNAALGAKKIDGTWHWVKYGSSEKVENPDIADTYNTVLKMAKKRSFVDAVLNTTAASDMFTQDIEDLPLAGSNNDTPVSAPVILATDTQINEFSVALGESSLSQDVVEAKVAEFTRLSTEAAQEALDKVKAQLAASKSTTQEAPQDAAPNMTDEEAKYHENLQNLPDMEF